MEKYGPKFCRLYHGTSEKFLQKIYDTGFILPSDYAHNQNCKRNTSGAPTYSLCDNTCPDCAGINRKKHNWNQCHMYGLGIYFADIPQKSDLYVSDSSFNKKNKKGRKIILCKVALGKTFDITTDLKNQDDYHDYVEPPIGYDSIFVLGRGNAAKGYGVLRTEYILFNPFQALPEFEIEYDLQ